jgi:hypothetical protein
MLDGAVVIPIQTMVWNLLFELAALLWVVDRALLSVGYFILVLTGWLSQNVFAPLLAIVSDQTGVLVGPLFMIALTVLGFTYLMAVFGRFEVVNLRSAVMWLLFAATLYTFGPGIYSGLEDFRRLVGGGFYEAGVEAFNDASSVTGLNAIGTLPSDSVAVPTDQFGQFLPAVPGAAAVDGLDVAMAYIGADGYDVLAASGAPHLIARLPWNMVEEGSDGYFDPDTGPNAFNSMTDADRQASIGRALQGVWRAFTTIFIAIFGIIEQLVNFLMAASFAVAFFSMFIAVLFGFFIRTEPIAWGAFNLIIELFIQSIINSLLMSLVLGFVMVGANTGNAILLLGASLVGLWMSWNLLQGCIKALMNSSERLYKSFSASTGGNFATVSETNQALGEATVSAATGASVLAGGGSFLQAMGATFGDSRTAQTMNYASRMLGGEDTLLGSMAQTIGEGASARSLAGPLGGYLLGQQSKSERREERNAETRRRYRGENDNARDAAVNDYVETGDEDALDSAFSPTDKPKVQALRDSFEPDDFDTVVNAVRNIRNDNPSLPPQSPAFTAKVREQLSSPLREMEAPALDDFAQVFGKAADASLYADALDFYTPPNIPIPSLGNADFARDDAIGDYRQAQATGQPLPNLEDAFSPEDANRVAQLMDAYDDDDFAQAIYAVRAAREANPDMPTGSSQALQATRRNLPDHLQNMPSRDLAAFSRAFGASATRPAIPDNPPATYFGSADRDRDMVVDAYRDGDESGDILEQSFSAQDAREVATLANEYERDDFDAVVRVVRQARTADPDMEAGSPYAVRQARKLLPEHLRQMPSSDLTAYSRAFGTSADTPSVRERRSSASPRSSRWPRPRSFAEERANDFTLQGNALETEAENPDNLEFNSQNLPIPEQGQESLVSAENRQMPIPDNPIHDTNAIPTMRGLGTARLQRLADMGISTLEQLHDASPLAIATALRVSEGQAQSWQMQAQTLLTTGAVAGTTIQTGLNVASQMNGQPNLQTAGQTQTKISSPVSQAPTQPGNSQMQPTLQGSGQINPTIAANASSAFVPTTPQTHVQSQQLNLAQQPSGQIVSTPDVPSAFVPNQPQSPVQTQQVNVPIQPRPQDSGQTVSTPNVPPSFVPNQPQMSIQSQQANLPQQPTQQTTGQTNLASSAPQVPTAQGNRTQTTTPQASGQVKPAPNVPPTFISNTPQTPVQANQVNAQQSPMQQTSGSIASTPNVPTVPQERSQVTSVPNVPPAFAPNEPQPSTSQASGQTASTPNVPTVPQERSQVTSVPNVPPAFAPNEPQPSTSQASGQTASTPNVPPSFVPNQSQAPIQSQQANLPQQPIQQTTGQTNIAFPASQAPTQQGNRTQTTTQQASGQLNPAPPTPTTRQVQPNPQIPSTSPQATRRQVVEPPVNRPTVSSTASSTLQSQSPSMATKQNEGFSQRDGTIPPAPITTNSGDIQPTEREKPAKQKPAPAQEGDSVE